MQNLHFLYNHNQIFIKVILVYCYAYLYSEELVVLSLTEGATHVQGHRAMLDPFSLKVTGTAVLVTTNVGGATHC